MSEVGADLTPLRLPLEGGPVAQGETPPWLAALAVLLLLSLLAPLPTAWRALGVVLVIGLSAGRSWLRRRAARAPRGWVVVDDRQIVRKDTLGGSAVIAHWDEPFGLTVLVNPARTRALFAFTTTRHTRYIGVRVSERDGLDHTRELLARAVTVANLDSELPLGTGRGALLRAEGASTLLRTVTARASTALDRVYLSDSLGKSVMLLSHSLHVGDKTIDLTAPLEVRPLSFREGASAVYQGTWVRQGAVELVLVSPLPPEQSASAAGRSHDSPPSRELRVAIDRLFMPPLRQALERAPRTSRAGVPSHGGPRAVQT